MKTEYFNHPIKGLCILISEINASEFLKQLQFKPNDEYPMPPECLYFKDINKIADEIRYGRFIGCIKEMRHQTGWGLKEAKEYAEKYMRSGTWGGNILYDNLNDISVREYYKNSTERFIKDHTIPLPPEKLLEDGDFMLE